MMNIDNSNTQHFWSRAILWFFLFSLPTAQAAELTFTPQTPIVEINKTLTLSVSGAVGEIEWVAKKGTIQGEGSQVTYLAPNQAGSDVVAVLHSEGTGAVKIVITPPNYLSPENAQWEIFTNRDYIRKLAYEPNSKRLWVATEGGLEERDSDTGEVIAIYQQTDGLPSNDINALEFDQHGNLWLATANGLAKRSTNGHWQTITTKNSNLPNNIILAVSVDPHDMLWVGTINGVVNYSLTDSDEEYYEFHFEDGLPKERVFAIVTFPLTSGGLFIVFDTGMFIRKYDGSKWDSFPFALEEGSLFLEAITFDLVNKAFWMMMWGKDSETGEEKRELFYKNFTTGIEKTFPMNPQYSINMLHIDPQGRLWVGTAGDGLSYFTQDTYGQWGKFDIDSVPNGKYITALQADEQGNLWVGSGDFYGWQSQGLARLNVDGSWKSFATSDLRSNNVYVLANDNDGNLLAGTQRDIAKRNTDGTWELVDPDTKFYNVITSLVQDDQNGWWIGTFGQGLFYLDSAGNVKNINTKNSNLPSDIVGVGLDKSGNVWVNTTTNGLARLLADDDFEFFNMSNSPIPSDYNVFMKDDDNGGLWVGTGQWTEKHSLFDYILDKDGNRITHGGQGLLHRDAQGEWGQVLNTDNSPLPDNNIGPLHVDGEGGIWIGTFKGGLAHYKANWQWEIFNSDNSKLPGNWVTSLLSDENGIWIGTSNGYEIDKKGNLIYDSTGSPVMSSHAGLAYLDNFGNWLVFDTHNSNLPDNDAIQSLLSDGQGGVWIGTQRGGLAHLTFGRQTELCSQAEIDATTCQAIQQGKHAAIIIAAGGAQEKDPLWESTEAITTRIYRTLYRRGFSKSNIYYLSSKTWADFNGDGFNDRINRLDTERLLTIEDLQAAFNWAKAKGKLEQPLYVFFMDHGGEGTLKLSDATTLTVEQLKTMLDDYQDDTSNKLIAVIEACHSGSFIEPLSAPNRAIITSVKASEKAYFFEKKGFSRFLADYLLQGASFYESFQLASRDQGKLRGKNLKFQTAGSSTAITSQTPQLDDNQDGIFTTDDGEWLKQVYINGKFVTADYTLAVINQTPATTITTEQAVTLQAKATLTQGKVKRVWAVIRPPKMNLVLDTNGTPILAFPRLELRQSPDNPEIWQTTWDDAIYNGNYSITFYAEDNEKNIASSEQDTELTVTGGIEPPAQAQVQVHLEKTRYQRGETFKATLTEDLGWGYDLYVAIVMPDETFYSLKNTNGIRAVNQAKPWYAQRRQHGSLTVLDLTVPENLLAGQYCLYGILSPEQNDVFKALKQNLTVVGQQCFEIY